MMKNMCNDHNFFFKLIKYLYGDPLLDPTITKQVKSVLCCL